MKPSNVFQTVVLGLLLAGCQGKFRDPSREMAPSVTPSAIFASEVRQPSTAGVLDTHLKDVHGQSVGVSCVTCHSSQGGLI